MLFTGADGDHLRQEVRDALNALQTFVAGMTIVELARQLGRRLHAACPPEECEDEPMYDVSEGEDEKDENALIDAEEESEEDLDFEDDDSDLFGSNPAPAHIQPGNNVQTKLTTAESKLRRRVKRDLRLVQQAGYKVGILDGFNQGLCCGTISIAIRIAKLGLSGETMEAWDVDRNDYVVLLVRFEDRYVPLEQALQQATVHTRVKFLLGKCKAYKPSTAQAVAAFSELGSAGPVESRQATSEEFEFSKMFISNSLDRFLNESFLSLVKIRESRALSWGQANEEFLAKAGFIGQSTSEPAPVPVGTSPVCNNNGESAQARVTDDHLTNVGLGGVRSLPLIATQFTMHFFTRCTEYCLRCHRPLDKGFQALRPYVCPDPLCLFQYMAMGFGPSVENEVLTEPYVVDLLVSLCYASIQPETRDRTSLAPGVLTGRPATKSSATTSPASTFPIRTFPSGLHMKLPDLYSDAKSPLLARASKRGTILTMLDVMVPPSLTPNSWIAVRRRPNSSCTEAIQHAVITDVNLNTSSLTIQTIHPSATTLGNMSTKGAGQDVGVKASPVPDVYEVEVFPYDLHWSDLETDSQKANAMRHVLDTLPSVLDMEAWLTRNPHALLRSMPGVSPAAASLLQWIISSNRSCIFQVDRSRDLLEPGSLTDSPPIPAEAVPPGRLAGKGRNREHERIPGMDGWMQFKFVQGSSDKELRFVQALHKVAAQQNITQNPTIFAWHGSRLGNWHSIVRTGLDFSDIRYGRAYGHGVYFSRDQVTSMAYVDQHGASWPNSNLKVASCMSLNEIINAPSKFVSKSPHYVVDQLDWHQCRYLFAQTRTDRAEPTKPWAKSDKKAKQQTNSLFHTQAPGFEVSGQDGTPLQIPLGAVPSRERSLQSNPKSTLKRRCEDVFEHSDEGEGDDLDLLMPGIDADDDVETKPSQTAPVMEAYVARPRDFPKKNAGLILICCSRPSQLLTPVHTGTAVTSFVPGALDLDSLPRLDPPAWATSAASKALSKELKTLQDVQSKFPASELGWYMDFEQTTNLFQWIVELHSFDLSHPLGADMKRAGTQSIVLEIRFGQNYPMDPPFVRVIRPRFLPFMNGGGGHVTAGGAMCMELLTSTGWRPVFSMESVFIQIRLALCSLDPRPARLEWTSCSERMDYGMGEALAAFVRAAGVHKWRIPQDVLELQRTRTM